MADPHIFEITDGYFGLALIGASDGDTFQSPAGDVGSGIATAPIAATLADYTSASDGWRCQVTQGSVTARASTRTVTRRPTFCAPGASIPTPDESTFTMNLRFYQDVDLDNGATSSLSLWLFEHDTEEAYVYLGFDGDDPPTLVGRVRLASGQIGGDPRTPLESTVALPFSRKPLIEPVPA